MTESYRELADPNRVNRYNGFPIGVMLPRQVAALGEHLLSATVDGPTGDQVPPTNEQPRIEQPQGEQS